MRSALKTVAAALAFAGLSACGDSTGPESSLSGAWSGNTAGVVITCTLSEADDGGITGSGNISGEGPTASLTITGTHTGANVSLVITPSGFNDINFSGTVSADGNTITGALNGSGFTNEAYTLRR